MRSLPSGSSIHKLSSLHRLQLRHLSTSSSPLFPPIDLVNTPIDNSQQSDFWPSSLKWLSGVTVASGLGLVLYYSSSDSLSDFNYWKKSFLSFVDRSVGGGDSPNDDRRSRFVFRKFALDGSGSYNIFGDAFRRKVFFNYEKRIRGRSSPEKVFEYFASSRTPEGELLMKPADLMRAIVPVFPPSESHLVRDGYLSGERSPGDLRCDPSEFFMLFDMNNDGLISFKEYIFFVTLLSIPESSFSVAFRMFDIDNNGEINKEEFQKVMALMRSHTRQGALHMYGLRIGLKVNGSVENGGLVEYFFGHDGKARLCVDKFVQFLRDLHDEILRLEFDHYDYKLRRTISAKDFALSIIASADTSHLQKLLDRVDELHNVPHIRDIQITLEEFKHFAELRRKLQPFALALFSYGKLNGLLTKEDFQRAASHVCGVSLTDNVIEIIFHVFDTNSDGNLSAEEFMRVLQTREKDISQPVEAGAMGFLSCCWDCASESSVGRFLG